MPSGSASSHTWKAHGKMPDVDSLLEPCVTLLSQRKVWQCIMAGSKRVKCGGTPKSEVRQGGVPLPGIKLGGDPDSIMKEHPSWRLASCDMEPNIRWSFHEPRLSHEFWTTIFPKLQDFERMTWSDIFISAKKQNHAIDVASLNKPARDRFSELCIEAEAIHSLRLGGTIRLYGFLTGPIYNILWYDNDHGDNGTCVCRSVKKHT